MGKKGVIFLKTWHKEGLPENLFVELAPEFVIRHQLKKQSVTRTIEELTLPLIISSAISAVAQHCPTTYETRNYTNSNKQDLVFSSLAVHSTFSAH